MAIAFHFLQILTFYEMTSTLLSATKVVFRALRKWCYSPYFPCKHGSAPATQTGTTRIHTRGPNFRIFSCMTFLIFLLTPSLHIEMNTYCTSYIRGLQPAGLLRPSGEFCAAREGFFTKYNALGIEPGFPCTIKP